MVLVQRHDIRKRAQCMGNYGAGIGKVYTRGGKRLRKRNKVLESFGSKLLNGLLDAGKNLYDNNKDSINKALKEKAGNIVNNLVEKAKDSELVPDILKKKIVDNSDLISNVSKKYIDQMINKGSQIADVGVNMGINKARSYDPALQMSGEMTEVPYIKRDATTTILPQSSNIYKPVEQSTPRFSGSGYKKRGRGLNIL